MGKNELLLAIKQMAAQKQISQEELQVAYASGLSDTALPTTSLGNHLKLTDILYYIGGAIVFLGITFMVSQNWDMFSPGLRIFITLGSMVAAFIVGAIFLRYENFRRVSHAFFLISGLLTPLSVEITLKEIGMDLSSNSVQLFSTFIMSTIFLSGYFYLKQTILLFFSIAFLTAVFHFVISLIVGPNLDYRNEDKVWQYQFLVIGLAYIALGYYLKATTQKALTGVLYGFGCLFSLGSTMALGGWSPNQNAFWELIYPILVFGVIFASVHLKSRAFLVFGTIFLIGYIFKLTGEYFSSGLGWPLALVLAGLAIMGIGFYAVRLNKKYFIQHI